MLTAAAVALPAATAHAQGAGDDQYQDPFGNTKSSSPKSQTHHQVAQTQSQPGLSTSPPSTTSAPSSSAPAQTQSSTASAAPTAAAAPAATALPRTGMELPGMALLGIGLLASGVGLRLRTLDERDF
jgi:hypothetical protein